MNALQEQPILSFWHFMTDFGDTAVTVPLAVLMFGSLVVLKELRLALIWAAVILGCAGAMGGLKILLAVCANPLASAGLISPSGHTAMTAAVYGGFAGVLRLRAPPAARLTIVLGAALLILCVALSRILLHLHSTVEVAVGLAVGLMAAAVFAAIVSFPRERFAVPWLVGGGIALAFAFHGARWPAEDGIRHIAALLSVLRPFCG